MSKRSIPAQPPSVGLSEEEKEVCQNLIRQVSWSILAGPDPRMDWSQDHYRFRRKWIRQYTRLIWMAIMVTVINVGLNVSHWLSDAPMSTKLLGLASLTVVGFLLYVNQNSVRQRRRLRRELEHMEAAMAPEPHPERVYAYITADNPVLDEKAQRFFDDNPHPARYEVEGMRYYQDRYNTSRA